MDALIGYTGFVGQTLARQHPFEARFNTSNIDMISDGRFGTVVCAAAPGSMFEANKLPELDRQKVHDLIAQLSGIVTRRFILISSIAVLADLAGGDDEATKAFQIDLAYGRHRRELEAICEETFDDCLIVRLPALFGKGLRKNFIFDLLNPMPSLLTQAKLDTLLERLDLGWRDLVHSLYRLDDVTGMQKLNRTTLNGISRRPELEQAVTALGLSAIQFHNPKTTYQYYDMSRLWNDIGVASEAGLRHIHLATEPLGAAQIHKRLLGSVMPDNDARLHHERMTTSRAELWGCTGPYLEYADVILERLATFFQAEKKTAS